MFTDLQKLVFDELFAQSRTLGFEYAEWAISQQVSKIKRPSHAEFVASQERGDDVMMFKVMFITMYDASEPIPQEAILQISKKNVEACRRAQYITEITQILHRGETYGTPLVTGVNGKKLYQPLETVNHYLFHENEAERPGQRRLRGTNQTDPLNFTNQAF